jgi:polysaccharide biosynthesis protein PslH
MGDILFLAHRVPYPPDRGDKMRSFHILKGLAKLAPVHLIAFADDARDVAEAEALRPLVASLHVELRKRSRPLAALAAFATAKPISLAAFESADVRRAVKRVLADHPIETIFAFSGQMAQYVPAGPRFVMDFVDMDSAKFAAYAGMRGPLGRLHAREARLLGAFERATAMRADTSLFVSEAEAALFRPHAPGARVEALENGIDLAFYDPQADFARLPAGEGPLIVFTGQMDYRPNIEAVTSFAASLPRIRAAHPQARFAIVGRNPDASVRRLAEQPGVIVTGAVDDVRTWLDAADVAVAPLRIARGVQNKVLEAMAMAKAVIASPAAAEGIDAVPGRHLLVADETQEAAVMTALLGDPARAQALGQAARAQMQARYGWDEALRPLARLVGRTELALGAAA